MTSTPVPLSDLVETRDRLIADIKTRLDEKVKTFLLSLHDCKPDFDIIGYPDAVDLPAVRWKLLNLGKLKSENSAKHEALRNEIIEIFETEQSKQT